MSQYVFKIQGMDCAEEITILKRALFPVIPREEQLGFDLLNGKITIDSADSSLSEESLIKLINKTGMQAIAWKAYSEQAEKKVTFWKQHHRSFMTLISALFLLLGYIIHGLHHGFLHAAIGKEAVGYTFPISSMGLYFLSVITGGWFIFPKAWLALLRFRPDMNLLMTIAVIGAMIIGQWFEAATVAFLFSLALLLETWSVGRARLAIRALLALAPNTARVFLPADNKFIEQPVDAIAVDAIVVIRPGEKVPLDGQIIQGETHVNQAPITGESMPIPKKADDRVYAGSINGEGVIHVRVTKLSKDTTLAHIIKRIEEAQAHRAPTEQWVDAFARYYTPLMMVLAIIVALVPPLLFDQSWMRWFYEGLVILVIACPCALVISTPVSIVAGLSAAARAGVLIKGGAYLELPARLKAVAFDKTGTLTQGKPTVQTVIPLGEHTEAHLLRIAAALENHNQHPIAHAILVRAQAESIDILPAEYVQAIQGKGVQGRVEGALYWVGSHRLMQEKMTTEVAKEAQEQVRSLEASGHTVVIIGRDDHVCGLIGVADVVRDNARAAVAQLKKLGIKKVFMLTGDNEGTAKAIAQIIGIVAFQSELLPEDKINQVHRLAKEYSSVAMVGDGINDAPAMASASLGIAMGAIGSDVAIETADVALMTDDLTKIGWLISHSHRTMRVIKQNTSFSFAIKVIFLTLAIAGIATLWMAIAADMGASLVVIFNGLRLLRSRTG